MKRHFKPTILIICVLGVLSVVLSLVLSFVIGVFLLDFTFHESSWYGTILYYPYISLLVLGVLLFVLRKRNQWTNMRLLWIGALLCGGLYSFISIWTNHQYLQWMYILQLFNKADVYAHIGYSPYSTHIIIVGVLLSAAVVVLGHIRKNEKINSIRNETFFP